MPHLLDRRQGIQVQRPERLPDILQIHPVDAPRKRMHLAVPVDEDEYTAIAPCEGKQASGRESGPSVAVLVFALSCFRR